MKMTAYCPKCSRRSMALQVLPTYETTRWHDGTEYTVEVQDLQAFRCSECGTIRLPQESSEQVEQKFMLDRGIPFPQEIRALRELHRWSEEDLALVLGVQKQDVESWEAGRTFPSVAINDRLALLRRHADAATAMLRVISPRRFVMASRNRPIGRVWNAWALQGHRHWIARSFYAVRSESIRIAKEPSDASELAMPDLFGEPPRTFHSRGALTLISHHGAGTGILAIAGTGTVKTRKVQIVEPSVKSVGHRKTRYLQTEEVGV